MEKVTLFFAQLDISPLPQITGTEDGSKLNDIFNVFIGILAVIAVLIIVLAGFKYITSAGDPQGVASARKAIIYAVVGLIVCTLSWALVRFVLQGL